MKKSVAICLLCLFCLLLSGCQKHKKDELKGISADDIESFSLESYDEKTDVYTSIAFSVADKLLYVGDNEISLSDEQCGKLCEYILQYSYRVQEKEQEYWPHTDEYPEMRILFDYRVEFGQNIYKQNGALCYPDGWQEFVDNLLDMQ